jgi:hypothetical protein
MNITKRIIKNWTDLFYLIEDFKKENEAIEYKQSTEENYYNPQWVFEDKEIVIDFKMEINIGDYRADKGTMKKNLDLSLKLFELIPDFNEGSRRYITFNQDVSFAYVEFKKDLWLQYCIFKWEMLFSSCSFSDWLQLHFNTFEKSLRITSCKFNICLELMSCSIQWDCKIDNIEGDCNVDLSFSCYANELNLLYSKVKKILILDSYFKNFKLDSISTEEWNELLVNITFGTDYLWILEHFKKYVTFNKNDSSIWLSDIKDVSSLDIKWLEWKKRTKINNLIVSNFVTIEDSREVYYFDDLDIKNLYISHSRFLSKNCGMRGNKIKNLSIINSNLGEFIFNGIDIETLFLKHITLNKCIFNNLKFPKKYLLKERRKELDWDGFVVNNKRELRDTYRQLKKIMDSSGNIIEANKFYANELFYELKDLEKQKIYKSKKDLLTLDYYVFSGHNLGDRIVLKTSLIISDFWNNWLSALVWLMMIAFLWTCLNYLYIQWINFPAPVIIPENLNISPVVFTYSVRIVSLLLLLAISIIFIKFIVWLIEKFPIITLFLVFFIIFFFFDQWLVNNFLNFLYPLYGFGEEYNSSIELFGFIIYKVWYGIILWHLIIALKRLTRR